MDGTVKDTISSFERYMLSFYLFVELAILILIQLPGRIISGSTDTVLMYSAIVCNTTVMLFFLLRFGRKKPDDHFRLIALALFITTVADLFLTYLGTDFAIPGVLCFCLVETVYAFWLKSPVSSVILRAVLFALLSFGAFLTQNGSVLNLLAVLNISVLAVNVFDAWRAKRFDPGPLFKIGVTLFFCCDLCVGLSSLFNGPVGRITGSLIWVFYIPSQVLITLTYVAKQIRSHNVRTSESGI